MISYEMMKLDHIPAVARLERENFSLPWSENAIKGELDRPLSLWIVAVDNGEVVGYIGSQIVPDEADMMNVAVSSTHRRMGIGRELVCRLVSALKEQGIRSLSLEVRVSNEPACALYEKLGFVVVGRRPNYYQKPKEDAFILRKEWQV